jgi:predicted O-methyltransferase YrrM
MAALTESRTADASPFSLDASMLSQILRHAKPLGHHEDPRTLNLGFGFMYYALARALRPRHVVVIGSGYGFSVVCLALGLRDNGAGRLSFVDPSYSLLRDGPLQTVGGTAKWSDPRGVREHFARFGVEDIVTHHRMTSAEFFDAYPRLDLGPIDLGFIDGNHSYADVRHDFVAMLRHAPRDAYILLHDTNLYVREFLGHAGVARWTRILDRDRARFQLVDFPFASGVAIVRVVCDGPWEPAD